jgi:hypothetical protein
MKKELAYIIKHGELVKRVLDKKILEVFVIDKPFSQLTDEDRRALNHEDVVQYSEVVANHAQYDRVSSWEEENFKTMKKAAALVEDFENKVEAVTNNSHTSAHDESEMNQACLASEKKLMDFIEGLVLNQRSHE